MDKSVFNLYESFQDTFWYVVARQDLLKRLLKIKEHRPTILDLGCGPGLNNPALKKLGTVIGIDYNAEPLRICRKKLITNTVQGDAQALPFRDHSFDIVVAVELFEHLKYDRQAIEEAYRVLKPKGKMVFTVPAHKNLWSSDDDLAQHFRRYSNKGIRDLVKNFSINFLGHRYFFIAVPSIIVFWFSNGRNSLSMSPGIFNSWLIRIMQLENYLISKRISLPFGIGWLAVVTKS